MDDLAIRQRAPAPREGLHTQCMSGIVLALFSAGVYFAVLVYVQHQRRPMPDQAEWIALGRAAPFLLGTLLAFGNAVLMLFGRRVGPIARLAPVLIALMYFAWFVLRIAFR